MFEGLPALGSTCSLVIFFVCATLAARASAATPALNAGFDSTGLTSLKFGDTEFLKQAHPELISVKPDSAADAGKDTAKPADQFDPNTHSLKQTYGWGSAKISYRVRADRLAIDLSIHNTSRSAITEARFDLMHLQFPATPTGYDWEHRYGAAYQTADALPALLANWGSARLALCNDDLEKPVKFSFSALEGEPWALNLWFDGKPIVPGATRAASISIRFAGDNAPGWAIARDVLHKFAEKYPAELQWPDRRPIGSAFLATSIAGYKNNPRGWFLDPDLNTNTPEGRAEFHTKVMKYADDVIAHCKLMDAQGVIVWDLEGQEMPHATSYLADPRILSNAAPEMDAIADEMFKKFTDAGLRTGITIRPTRVEPELDGKTGWRQVEIANPVAEMDAKITYAQKRWGCSIFYCDSNVNFVRDSTGKILNDPAMAATDFLTLFRRHKGCLLIPEHKTARYWSCTAPYSELRLGIASTAPEIRQAYPHALSVIRVVDGPPLDSDSVSDQMVSAIQGGDILLFRPWWDDPTTAQIKELYTKSTTRPIVRQ